MDENIPVLSLNGKIFIKERHDEEVIQLADETRKEEQQQKNITPEEDIFCQRTN